MTWRNNRWLVRSLLLVAKAFLRKAFPGGDGRVRKVQVQYKNPKPGEAVNEYHGRGFVTVERAVNKLVVLIPKEEDKDTKNWTTTNFSEIEILYVTLDLKWILYF